MALAGDPARGEVLAGMGLCESCHTADGGQPYAGGHAIETRFGTFYGSNLTPDAEHGIGGWSEADFVGAMRRGRSPDGHFYWPAFPTTAFTNMRDDDLRDVWSWLQTLEPSSRPNDQHNIKWLWRGRWKLAFWRVGSFREGPLQTDDVGQYLVDSAGHCNECHTPRGGLGGTKRRRYLQGDAKGPEGGPDLVDLDWSTSDWETFLEMGMTAESDFVGGVMYDVVDKGTSKLSAEERRAMAEYLSGL